MKKFVLIVAGGRGVRMDKNIPKQFIEIAGRPVLMHTFDRFYNFDSELEFVLALPEDQVIIWKQLCEKHRFEIEHQIAHGGENRFNSVKNGLDLISNNGIVFIHDGVRPLVSGQTIQNCLETAIKKGNALPVVPVSESIRMADGIESIAVDRSSYFLVQTPQTFQAHLIKAAYQKAKPEGFTDDATVLESFGETIHLVEGNRGNIKITFPEDLIFAEIMLKKLN